MPRANVIIGKTYPEPIVSLGISREVALEPTSVCEPESRGASDFARNFKRVRYWSSNLESIKL